MTFNTPATPHKGIILNLEIDPKIAYDIHNKYSSGIGLLLYLVKHSQPELFNVVRELYKRMMNKPMECTYQDNRITAQNPMYYKMKTSLMIRIT